MSNDSKNKVKSNVSTNLVLDRMWMGAAWAFFVFAGYKLILDHVQATGGLNYVLAGVGTVFLLYAGLAPLFRSK